MKLLNIGNYRLIKDSKIYFLFSYIIMNVIIQTLMKIIYLILQYFLKSVIVNLMNHGKMQYQLMILTLKN